MAHACMRVWRGGRERCHPSDSAVCRYSSDRAWSIYTNHEEVEWGFCGCQRIEVTNEHRERFFQ